MTVATTTSGQAERLRALAGEQLDRDRWSRDQLLAWQGGRLRALLRHATAASPYYPGRSSARTPPPARCRCRRCPRCPRPR